MGFMPKPSRPPGANPRPFDPRGAWLEHYFELQLFDGATPDSALTFSLEREHPVISEEVYGVLEAILAAP
jgi:hypothetical protein